MKYAFDIDDSHRRSGPTVRCCAHLTLQLPSSPNTRAADDTIANKETELAMFILFLAIESRRWETAEVALVYGQRWNN